MTMAYHHYDGVGKEFRDESGHLFDGPDCKDHGAIVRLGCEFVQPGVEDQDI